MLKEVLIQVLEPEKEETKEEPVSCKNKNTKPSKPSKRNRPRIFSRDFNKLPVSCSPK